MDGPKAPVYTRSDGTIVKLSIPLENKRWNELNPTLKRRCELHYTPYEMRALHIRTGNKAVVINTVYDSAFRPKKVILTVIRVNGSWKNKIIRKFFLIPVPTQDTGSNLVQ